MLENNYDDSIPSMNLQNTKVSKNSENFHGFKESSASSAMDKPSANEVIRSRIDKAYGSKNSENFHGSKNSENFHGFKESKIYPVLPTAPSDEGHTYRLQKIGEIQKEIENEKKKRIHLSKKYHRAFKIISFVDSSLQASGIALGVVGIGFLSTIAAAPVAIACEGVAIGAGFLSIVGGQVNKKLALKAEKHEKIKVLAESKLNTINSYISKALVDDIVSDSEYELILSELQKFKEMMREIRDKTKIGIDEITKESLINKGREEAINAFNNMFKKST